MSKEKIAKEFKDLTFTDMQEIDKRPLKELKNVLKYEKSLRGK